MILASCSLCSAWMNIYLRNIRITLTRISGCPPCKPGDKQSRQSQEPDRPGHEREEEESIRRDLEDDYAHSGPYGYRHCFFHVGLLFCERRWCRNSMIASLL